MSDQPVVDPGCGRSLDSSGNKGKREQLMNVIKREAWHGRVGICLLAMAAAVSAGCATAPPDEQLRERATLCLHRGMRYPGNPAVRAQSIEAGSEVLGSQVAPIIREGLGDEHPGVRFAACMALGKLADRESAQAIRGLALDTDLNVRIGVYYALERLGDPSYRRAWVEMMDQEREAGVRRNAVLALALLADPKTQTMLKRVAVEDPDDGVRLQAVEGLAILGDSDAEGGFIRDAFGGMGFRQPFALLALGHVNDPDTLAVLRSRLRNAPYLEARLAAARALGMQGRLDGFDLAINSLSWSRPDPNLPDDPVANQIMRVQSMAAMALGDMRDRRALAALNQCMEQTEDPRVQVAAARSILKILGPGGEKDEEGAARQPANG